MLCRFWKGAKVEPNVDLLLKQNQQLRDDKEKMGAEIERLRGGAVGHGLGAKKPEEWIEPAWWQL